MNMRHMSASESLEARLFTEDPTTNMSTTVVVGGVEGGREGGRERERRMQVENEENIITQENTDER